MKYIEEIPDIVRLASEIFRLADDYGTSSVGIKQKETFNYLHTFFVMLVFNYFMYVG